MTRTQGVFVGAGRALPYIAIVGAASALVIAAVSFFLNVSASSGH